MPVCDIKTCPGRPISRGLCIRHYREAMAAGTLPPKKKTVVVAAVRTLYSDPDREGHEGPSERDRQRTRTRRAIEDLEEALRLRREEAEMIEADW